MYLTVLVSQNIEITNRQTDCCGGIGKILENISVVCIGQAVLLQVHLFFWITLTGLAAELQLYPQAKIQNLFYIKKLLSINKYKMIPAIERLLQGKHLHTAAGVCVRPVWCTGITDVPTALAKLAGNNRRGLIVEKARVFIRY
ncbi:hypothetical protein [uncultured Gemmiger sp.]|uniref:hypothetical protein n=1 Tax=uncultured Gemmiger sp. TaxID=1623490 RepID=UPI0026262FDF|nr:hypothetical protein [uncultured Gemmiger sp.]